MHTLYLITTLYCFRIKAETMILFFYVCKFREREILYLVVYMLVVLKSGKIRESHYSNVTWQ